MLEEQLGFCLFDRRGRRIVLNAAGEALQRAVEPALDRIDDGVRAAAAAASGATQRIRVTLLPSFAQRWLLPRMLRWRERHPDIGIQAAHVAERRRPAARGLPRGAATGRRQLARAHRPSERLIDSPFIALGTPAAARRLQGRGEAALADEPLLGEAELWERFFALGGLRAAVNPVAAFNDAGLMLQAAEHGIGIALARELFAADALRAGRLVRLSPLSLPDASTAFAFWIAYPPELADWPPLQALRAWLHDEVARSVQELEGTDAPPA